MDLLKKNMEIHMRKAHGPGEYMDGDTWVRLMLSYEAVVIPSIATHLQPTARIINRILLEMFCITVVDIISEEIP